MLGGKVEICAYAVGDGMPNEELRPTTTNRCQSWRPNVKPGPPGRPTTRWHDLLPPALLLVASVSDAFDAGSTPHQLMPHRGSTLLLAHLEPDLDLARGETNSFRHFLPLPGVWEFGLRDASQQDIELRGN